MQSVADNHDEPAVTPEQVRRAAATLVTKEFPKEALAAIFEPAFGARTAGPHYPGEVDDLCAFIADAADNGCEDLDLRLLAMPFGYREMSDRACGKERAQGNLWAAAHLNLVRAVATYFLRTRAYVEVLIEQGDERDAMLAAARRASGSVLCGASEAADSESA